MRLVLFVFLFSLNSFVVKACDCDWGGDFLTAAIDENLVVKVKIIDHFQEGGDFNERMTVEIIKKYSGIETRDTISVWGGDMNDCRAYVDFFIKGQEYFFALSISGNKYILDGCSELFLTIVNGRVNAGIGVQEDSSRTAECDIIEFEHKLITILDGK